MRALDIPLFLVGNRGAIERIAGSWWSLLVAAVLVVSGGIARNYDHLDLLRNPEWLYGPFVASFITSLLVFAVVFPYLRLRKVRVKGVGYLSFMCVYWMTAPCAWLYAIPVESFTDLVTATRWNIAFLAIVSVWRVFLVTRALVVLTGAGALTSLTAVLFPASAFMCAASLLKGISLVGIMGGVRLPPHTELLVTASNTLCYLSFWTGVLLLLCMCVAVASGLRGVAERPLPWRTEQVPRRALMVAGACVVVGLIAVVPVQVKVQRNHRLETLIEGENYRAAIDYASGFERRDFSGIHYLPPDPFLLGSGNRHHYQGLLAEIDGSEPAWLREVWLDQFADSFLASRRFMQEEDAALVKRFPVLRERIEQEPDDWVRGRILEQLEERDSSEAE